MVTTHDYSQHGEQATILEWAAAAGARPGAFLDLGSYDGSTYSNTAALADRGWQGVCVDAAPDAAAACAAKYARRPDIDVILGAFDPEDRADPTLMHWSPLAMYTSALPIRRTDTTAIPILIAPINLDRLAARVGRLPHPLFCSIDLEGISIAALTWVLNHTHASCVCVEANNPAERAAATAAIPPHWTPLPSNSSNLLFAAVGTK